MKIRKHKKREYVFFPSDDNRKSFDKRVYIFKYKSNLMKFLNKHGVNSLNGIVRMDISEFGHSGSLREWVVWFNQYGYENKNQNFKIELKQEYFRGKKFIHKPMKISKESKKYFAFSDKVLSLMCNLEDDNGNIEKFKAGKLVKLFYKRGFKDFTPTEEDQEYIDYYLEKGIDFYYWSDRCNWLRTKTVIEYFKKKNLI
jgi:hypothetical protein